MINTSFIKGGYKPIGKFILTDGGLKALEKGTTVFFYYEFYEQL